MKIVLQKPRSKRDFIGLSIVFCGKLATKSAKYCHVEAMINTRTYGALLFSGVSGRDYSLAFKSLDNDVYELPTSLMSEEGQKNAQIYLEGLIGQFTGFYGFGKIPSLLGDSILSFFVGERVFVFSNFFNIKSFPICSSLVAYVLYKFGEPELRVKFRNWRSLSPDDIHDILKEMGIKI